MTACARAVSERQLSKMLGVVSAAGSLGTLVVPLITQALLAHEAWQIGSLFFLLLAVAMLPAAFWAGSADRLPGQSAGTTSMREVIGQAVRNRRFLVLSGAYFVCGLNLVFLTTHLPAYLAICGHQVGSSLGAWGGGLLFDLSGSYDRAWQIGVLIGFAAGVVQIMAGGPTRRHDQSIAPEVATT
jgi:hypothetical protein